MFEIDGNSVPKVLKRKELIKGIIKVVRLITDLKNAYAKHSKECAKLPKPSNGSMWLIEKGSS